MRFKFPKKIRIGAFDYKMIYDKTEGGGSFCMPYKGKGGYIKIGTRDMGGDQGDFLAVLIHELNEILLLENCARYTQSGTSSDYVFNYRHDVHCVVSSALAGLLKEFIA